MKKDKKAILDTLNKETKINAKFFGFILNKVFSKLQSDEYEYDGKVAYTADKKTLICCLSEEKEIVVPEGVEEIGDMAFHGDNYLEKITFPSTLKKIGKDAFSECQNLEEIVIPASVDTIRGYAFGDCDGLHDITFEGQPELLARGIFEDCDGLRTIIVPDGTAKAFRKALRLGGDLDYIIVQKNSEFAPGEETKKAEKAARKALKEAKKAEKEAAKQAAKDAKQAEKDAKAADKQAKEAIKAAKKEAKKAEKEAKKANAAQEQITETK